MARPRSPRTRQSPGQRMLDELLRSYPEATRYVWTPTGKPMAVLDGGAPEPRTPPSVARRAA